MLTDDLPTFTGNGSSRNMPNSLPLIDSVPVGPVTDQQTSAKSGTKNCPGMFLTPIDQFLD